MDESTNQLTRDELLKLGGAGALAAVSMLLAETSSADAGNKDYPVGLDYTTNGFHSSGKPNKAKLREDSVRVRLTNDKAEADASNASYVFHLAKPKSSGSDEEKCKHGHKFNGDLWVLVWKA